jgi:hypothetical protein
MVARCRSHFHPVGLEVAATKELVSVERGHGLERIRIVGLQNLGRIGDAVGFNTKIGILAVIRITSR